jgi:hypothetical protein
MKLRNRQKSADNPAWRVLPVSPSRSPIFQQAKGGPEKEVRYGEEEK